LTKEQKGTNVVLLDFKADLEDDRTLRLDLNIVFNPLAVRRGKITAVDYYVGSTGVEVSLDVHEGKVSQYTGEATLEINYSHSTTVKRKSALSLAPGIKTKRGDWEMDAKLGKISHEASDAHDFTAKFTCKERLLAPVHMGNEVKWRLMLPRGGQVISDFLTGNLYLFAKCFWARTPKSGCIMIRPSDVRFFDDQRRPIGRTRSLIMKYVLWRRGVKLENRDGFLTEFEEVKS
jgi:hypothetical protein